MWLCYPGSLRWGEVREEGGGLGHSADAERGNEEKRNYGREATPFSRTALTLCFSSSTRLIGVDQAVGIAVETVEHLARSQELAP
jgi:hypothetical protein